MHNSFRISRKAREKHYCRYDNRVGDCRIYKGVVSLSLPASLLSVNAKRNAGNEYQNIGSALDCCDKEERPVVLVECMSNLLANECFGEAGKPDDIFDGCMKLYSGCRHLVIVTNEVFQTDVNMMPVQLIK